MDELQKKIVDYVEANGKTYQQIALEIHEKPRSAIMSFSLPSVLQIRLRAWDLK